MSNFRLIYAQYCYKINDQDPLYNTMKLTPHSVITYMEKKQNIYTFMY